MVPASRISVSVSSPSPPSPSPSLSPVLSFPVLSVKFCLLCSFACPPSILAFGSCSCFRARRLPPVVRPRGRAIARQAACSPEPIYAGKNHARFCTLYCDCATPWPSHTAHLHSYRARRGTPYLCTGAPHDNDTKMMSVERPCIIYGTRPRARHRHRTGHYGRSKSGGGRGESVAYCIYSTYVQEPRTSSPRFWPRRSGMPRCATRSQILRTRGPCQRARARRAVRL